MTKSGAAYDHDRNIIITLIIFQFIKYPVFNLIGRAFPEFLEQAFKLFFAEHMILRIRAPVILLFPTPP